MGTPVCPLSIPRMELHETRMGQAAYAMAEEAEKLLPRARMGRSNTADHLERATDSVLFNMGEGVTCYRPKVKIVSYDISRKEAGEVRVALRKLVIGRLYSLHDIAKAYDLAGAVIGMLTSAIKS